MASPPGSEDPLTTWTTLVDDAITEDSIRTLLAPVKDDLWVAAACLDRLVDNVNVQRSLLDLGLERTLGSVRRGQEAESSAQSSSEADSSSSSSLGTHFHDYPEDAQLCHVRATLLDRLDRLNTFVEICKTLPAPEEEDGGSVEGDEGEGSGVTEDLGDDWEDDPWGDGGAGEGADSAAEAAQPSADPNTHTQLLGASPIPLPSFLTDDLVSVASLFATLQQFSALQILLGRCGSLLWPFRLDILNSIPEHSQPSEYHSLLPAFDAATGEEVKPNFVLPRAEPDWVETSMVRKALGNVELSVIQSITTEERFHRDALSGKDLATWYRHRVDSIISTTGMIDIAFEFLQHGASQGVPDLDELGEDLSLLSRLIYDAPSGTRPNDEDWSLERWHAMDPPAAVRAYLAHSSPETLARDIRTLVMPYLFVIEARCERSGQADPELPTRLFHEYILSAPLELAAAVFDASKPTLPKPQRLIRSDQDVVRLALACLYGSDRLDAWQVMSHIFECLPAWDVSRTGPEKRDEAEATIASLGAFVTPTTARPRTTPADLLGFFTPLPVASLSRALDILDVHLESGEILARWGVPAPLRWFLQSRGDAREQRTWAERMARKAQDLGEAIDTEDEWERLLDDMLKLAGKGNEGLRGAFGLLRRREVIRIFFSGVISSGDLKIAKTLLRKTSGKLSLDSKAIEEICLACSREFYDNASHGNYNVGEMKLAYECLDIPPQSDNIRREKDFIEATSRISSFNVMSRPGIPISPIEIRLTKDRLSLVSRVLSSNSDAYKHSGVILDLAYKLGYREDKVAETKVLAMIADAALQAEDFDRAYETSQEMVKLVLGLRATAQLGPDDPHAQDASEICWVACFQLGRQSEFPDNEKKLLLLGRALELCPADRIADILTAWRRLENERAQLHAASADGRRGRRGRGVSPRKKAAAPYAAVSAAASIAARLQGMRVPELRVGSHAPDAAALASKTFSRVAANFPFGRDRSVDSATTDRERSSSRAEDVSTHATRALQKGIGAGIGWLIGGD